MKTNIGHLEPASGIAGLIKVILSIRHATLPDGLVHLDQLNPYVELADTPFYPVSETMPWPRAIGADGRPQPLRAGVSSFGFGGVNAHVILEEPPVGAQPTGGHPTATPSGGWVFVFSAKTVQALDRGIDRFLDRLERWDREPGTAPNLDLVAATLREGREEFAERLAVVATDLSELRSRLRSARRGMNERGVHRGQVGPSIGGGAVVVGGADEQAAGWVAGRTVEWPAGPIGTQRRTSLPSYSFDRTRYWFTSAEPTAHPDDPGTDAPRTEAALTGEAYIRSVLRGILLAKLKLTDDILDDDRPLQDFGVDSILGAMVVQVVQEEFDIQIPVTALVEYPTVRALAGFIHTDFFADREPPGSGAARRVDHTRSRDDGDRAMPELLPISVGGTKQPSFWVHGATGYSVEVQNLPRLLGPD